MKARVLLPFLSSVVIAASSGYADGATLSLFSFGTDSAGLSFASSASEPGVTSSALTVQGGLVSHNSGGNFSDSGPRAMGLTGNGTGNTTTQVSRSADEAFTNADYLSFAVTTTPGSQLALTNFSFYANLGNSVAIVNNYTVRMINPGVNGGAAVDLGSGEITRVVGGAGAGTGDGQLVNIPLSYAGLTGVTTFQILFYETDTAITGWQDNWLRIDDIRVSGTVSAIPEAGVSLLCVPVAALLLRRRRA